MPAAQSLSKQCSRVWTHRQPGTQDSVGMVWRLHHPLIWDTYQPTKSPQSSSATAAALPVPALPSSKLTLPGPAPLCPSAFCCCLLSAAAAAEVSVAAMLLPEPAAAAATGDDGGGCSLKNPEELVLLPALLLVLLPGGARRGTPPGAGGGTMPGLLLPPLPERRMLPAAPAAPFPLSPRFKLCIKTTQHITACEQQDSHCSIAHKSLVVRALSKQPCGQHAVARRAVLASMVFSGHQTGKE